MKTTSIGFLRIGAHRELKKVTESYFKGEIKSEELEKQASILRKTHWELQRDKGLDLIPVNDFSLYDTVLDTAVLLNVIPKRYVQLHLSDLDMYFAMARGYQGKNGDVKALAMKKWYNTNYHYLVPEIEDDTEIRLAGTKIFDECNEALSLGIPIKPVIIGAFTFLQLAHFSGKKTKNDVIASVIVAYTEILQRLQRLGVSWISVEEPALVTDLDNQEIELFRTLYREILKSKNGVHVVCQTYFGDVRDCYEDIVALDFDGIGLDFCEGKETYHILNKHPLPKGKVLFAGIVNGKNIWRNHYEKTLALIDKIKPLTSEIVLNTSCSLLHVPFSTRQETQLPIDCVQHLAFAEEKLTELSELSTLVQSPSLQTEAAYLENVALFASPRTLADEAVQKRVSSLTPADFIRVPDFFEREKIQKEEFHFPLLPTTTIGSFPQTKDVRKNRADFRKKRISAEQYKAFNKKKIAACIALQEEIGLDVLVHGEFERNDMVEYFGEHLNGFLFTEQAWVQSYGTRCVKPPIIWGDVSRCQSITTEWSVYAQSLTSKPVKGMLTGPVTILNWSFPREDIPLKESVTQIALAIRDEVLDLERQGIRIIQIDEAALREKLPLRKADWHTEYLDWAIPSFCLLHSGVKATTQIHTHMCYSEFNDIIADIDAMDADVITFEAARSDLTILSALSAAHFRTEVGPGVYDIHSPRIPSTQEIKSALFKMLEKIPIQKLWVNPDCGLKTRGNSEVKPSLQHMVLAAQSVRNSQ
ncbi:MAG: 5-methyltetrahydropteroyltriglutamate--homocysteine S-methyltransferase [Megasphaera sp.]|jgi:5-methyltetrahydropteroyltriglutamate--homocysteine methyltransferase|nr:5-methyltetrahydropteroyltriglutamate--homocysteine S-methyltransferase [Megasphaera sp.]